MKIFRSFLSVLAVFILQSCTAAELPVVFVQGTVNDVDQITDAQAQYERARAYQEGNGLPKDIEAAKRWYSLAAAQGHVYALYALGKIAQRPKHLQGDSDLEAAVRFYTQAAVGHETLAQFELAKMHYSGLGLEKSVIREKEWLEKIVNLVTPENPMNERAYKDTVMKTQAMACVRLAEIYEEGAAVERSYERAKDLYIKAIDCDDTCDDAYYRLAQLYIRGEGVLRDITYAKALLAQTSETFVPTHCLLGRISYVDRNYPEAIKHYSKVQITSPEAQYFLSLLCEQGLGTPRDPENALALLRDSAQGGYPDAIAKLRPLLANNAAVQCVFGRMYRIGKAIAQDNRLALDLLLQAHVGKCPDALSELQALSKVYPEAKYALGKLYEEGRHVVANKDSAAVWYEQAALAGNAHALEGLNRLAANNINNASLALARFYEVGVEGCPKNIRKSCEHLEHAAANTSCAAALKLGDIHLSGQLGEPDGKNGVDWYRQAAQLHSKLALTKLQEMADTSAIACYALGQLYQEGRGVACDLAAAQQWLEKSAEQDYVPAYYALALFHENQSFRLFQESSQIIECYEKVLKYYERAAKVHYSDARENVQRIRIILEGFRKIINEHGMPIMQNHLCKKLREMLPPECPLEVLFWAAHFTVFTRLGFDENIQSAVCCLLITIAQFGRKGELARALLKMLYDEIHSKEFCANSLDEKANDCRVKSLCRISRVGAQLKGVGILSYSVDGLKRSDESIQDIWIDVFNALFRIPIKSVDDEQFVEATSSLTALFTNLLPRMGSEMLRDEELDQEADVNALQRMLTFCKTDRFKNRIIQCARVITTKLTPDMQTVLLASWARAGLHCATRAEEETYKFYILNMSNSESLDKENLGLEMRMAICLAELRKKCLAGLVSPACKEPLHQIAYLEKKAGKLLMLVGDAEEFNDGLERLTVLEDFKKKSKEAIKQLALINYTVEKMAEAIVEEANKRSSSRLSCRCITEHFERILGKPKTNELLNKLYENTGLLTKNGAKILLRYFGYLEG